MDWITGTKIPIGKWAGNGVDWLTDNAAWFFDGIGDAVNALISAILWVLQGPPPLVIVAIFAAIAWFLQRSWWTVALVVLGFLFILNQGYWEETTETLTLVLSAVVVCMGLGVPIGIAAAHRPRLYQVLRPILDLMQTLPTFVYLIPAIVFFGIGMVPGLIATAIFVIPGTDPADASRHRHDAQGAEGGRAWPSARRRASCCARSSCPGRCRRSWWG